MLAQLSSRQTVRGTNYRHGSLLFHLKLIVIVTQIAANAVRASNDFAPISIPPCLCVGDRKCTVYISLETCGITYIYIHKFVGKLGNIIIHLLKAIFLLLIFILFSLSEITKHSINTYSYLMYRIIRLKSDLN